MASDREVSRAAAGRLLARAYASEGEERAAAARDLLAFETPPLRAYGLCGQSMLAEFAGDLEQAFELGVEALEFLAQDPEGQAPLMLELAVNASRRGKLGEAEALFERGLTLTREHGFAAREAGFLANLGILTSDQGDPARALELLNEARGLYSGLGNRRGEGMVLINAGPIYRILGAYPDAIGALIEGIDILESEGIHPASGFANLAVIYAVAGIPDEAARCARRAEERAAAGSEEAVMALSALAFAHSEAGEHESAIDAAERGVAQAREFGDEFTLADVLLRSADARRGAGQPGEAEERYREGIAIAEGMDYLPLQFGFRLGMAGLFEQRGENAEALNLVEPFVDAWENYGERHTLIELHDLLSRLTEAQQEHRASLGHLRRAQSLRTDLFRRETDVRVRSIQAAHDVRREREKSAEALRGLSRRVMESQEEERRRVASDLHDDLGQRLALLAVELDMLAQSPPEDVSASLNALADQAQTIADQVHVISHHLHPSHLAQLGLVGATRGVCDEVARVHGVEIEFCTEAVPRHLSDDVSLCLYRIVQEGLSNAVRHGQAPRARVSIGFTPGQIQLELADEGVGFDPESLDSPGIGLAGMRERAHHLGGHFYLHSRPGAGTRIEVVLPLKEEE